MALTLYISDYNIFSMKTSKNIIWDSDSSFFIYSGLCDISKNGRKYLKTIAKSLISIQNHPGLPIPDRICQKIIQEQTDEL